MDRCERQQWPLLPAADCEQCVRHRGPHPRVRCARCNRGRGIGWLAWKLCRANSGEDLGREGSLSGGRRGAGSVAQRHGSSSKRAHVADCCNVSFCAVYTIFSILRASLAHRVLSGCQLSSPQGDTRVEDFGNQGSTFVAVLHFITYICHEGAGLMVRTMSARLFRDCPDGTAPFQPRRHSFGPLARTRHECRLTRLSGGTGTLYELDGLKKAPVAKGPTSPQTLLGDTAKAVAALLPADELRVNLMALAVAS